MTALEEFYKIVAEGLEDAGVWMIEEMILLEESGYWEETP